MWITQSVLPVIPIVKSVLPSKCAQSATQLSCCHSAASVSQHVMSTSTCRKRENARSALSHVHLATVRWSVRHVMKDTFWVNLHALRQSMAATLVSSHKMVSASHAIRVAKSALPAARSVWVVHRVRSWQSRTLARNSVQLATTRTRESARNVMTLAQVVRV